MADTTEKTAKCGRKTIKRMLLLTAAAALIWTGLVWFKDQGTKQFLYEYNTNAKNMYNLLNTLMTDAEKPPLPKGNYTGYGRIKGDTMTITPDDPSIAPFTASTNGYYTPEKPYYFSYRMEGSVVTQIRISQRDVLHKAPETTDRFIGECDDKLTMAECYLHTFVAYYPQQA